MTVKSFFLNLIALSCTQIGFAQIVTPTIPPPTEIKVKKEKDKEKSKEKKAITDSVQKTNEYVISYIPHNSTRSLTSNVAPYGKLLGELADEKSITNHDFEVVFRNQINKTIGLKFGLRFANTGEKYKLQIGDSTYSYITKYRYVALPIGVDFGFTLSPAITWISSATLLPQLNAGRVRKTTTVSDKDKTVVTSDKSTDKINTAVFGVAFTTGLKFRLSTNVNFYISPEARFNLSNTFMKQSPYVHKAKTFGLVFSLGIRI
jgi:hypothetical protein